mmetsp:Transcript_113361/g.206216  ORF Transcript_113361/g.206216 Transcript_113361/m.206216 type:complete len:85 (+) Transcript_113361:710-964(+)
MIAGEEGITAAGGLLDGDENEDLDAHAAGEKLRRSGGLAGDSEDSDSTSAESSAAVGASSAAVGATSAPAATSSLSRASCGSGL